MMNRSLVRLLLCAALLLGADAVYGATGALSAGLKLSDGEKLEVVKLTLEEVLVPTNDFLNKRQREWGIVISSLNLKKEWLGKLDRGKFQVLTPQQIWWKAMREGSFEYLAITEFKIEGDRAVIELSKAWARGKHDGNERSERRGLVMEFQKIGKRFVRRVINVIKSH